MTPEQLEALWQLGQQREAEGQLDAARDAYKEILAGSPRQIMVQVKLSELEQHAGRYRAARDYALQAADTIRLTRRWEGLAFVTANLLVFDERTQVRQLIGEADWRDPRVIGQSPVLSQQLWLCGDEEAALRLLDIAGQRGARDHRLAYSRAIALQHLGRIAEATAAFEDTLRLAPDFAPAHWSLAYHAPSVPPGARVERIRRAMHDRQEPLERAMLHYALYKELDDAGEHAAAWPELEQGAAAMRGVLGPSAGADDSVADPMPWPLPARADAAAAGPIFIVGMPRTGTTLLSRIVAAHPSVADAGEINALEHAVAERLDRFVDLPLRPGDAESLRAAEPAAVADAYRRRTQDYRSGQAIRILDKNPLNIYAAGIIAAAMPDARILCMVREPMDTGYSNLRQLFQNGAFAYSYEQRSLAEHYARFRGVVAHWQAALPGNFLAIPYESLVADPAGTARQALEFCGLEFDPAYVDITRNQSPSATASASQIREPIHAQGVGEWQRYQDRLQPLQARLRELGFGPEAR